VSYTLFVDKTFRGVRTGRRKSVEYATHERARRAFKRYAKLGLNPSEYRP
jgi:hypothetical protein